MNLNFYFGHANQFRIQFIIVIQLVIPMSAWELHTPRFSLHPSVHIKQMQILKGKFKNKHAKVTSHNKELYTDKLSTPLIVSSVSYCLSLCPSVCLHIKVIFIVIIYLHPMSSNYCDSDASLPNDQYLRPIVGANSHWRLSHAIAKD